MSELPILADNPIESADDDLWHLRSVADDLAGLIRSTRQPPLTIGVFGSWGTGKTSLLRLLREALETPGSAGTTWFDAWRYHDRQELVPALVHSVLTSVGRRSTDKVSKRLARFAVAASKVFAGRVLQALSQGLVAADDLDKVLDAWASTQRKRTEGIADFAVEFDQVMAEALDGGVHVVLIDDLDRCSPAAAMEVLEGVKLFLSSRHCVCVVALDVDVLHALLETVGGYGPERSVEYLEKLIQVARFVPTPSDAALREALRTLTGRHLPDEIWRLVSTVSDHNPRRAKRFLNTLTLARRGLPAAAADDHELIAARLMAMRVRFPKAYAALARDPGLWQRAERQLASRSAPASADPGLTTFLADERLAQFLRESGPDAREYFPQAPDAATVARLLRDDWRPLAADPAREVTP